MHAPLLARLWLYLLGVAYPALGLSMLRSFTNTGRPPSRRSGDFLLPGYGRLWRRHGWRPVDAPAHPEHWRQVEQAMIDTPVVAALDMYVEPDCVRQAGRGFIDEVCRRLGVRRCAPAAAELAVQWRQPNLLFAQACGYPLMTQLQGQVAVLAVPSYDLADCAPGEHCSLFVAAEGEARRRLDEFRDTRLALNGHDSNSGMNLLRHALAPLGRDAAFFAEVRISGGHVRSLAMVAAGEAELTSVDALTFAYLQRHAPERLAGLRVLGRSAPSPALPLITSLRWSATQRRELFEALNLTLVECPELARTLALKSFLPAGEEHYRILLDYERQAEGWGYPHLR
ncbi:MULTISPECIES: phosphate/phosphite/phosphonate ABC transporter substrate-binding protein [Pseudomonas aeruginosa group]|nr:MULTISPECIES: phosphate/phosphite/phosphonate ABC transporter substrate-binding protein [Pseudomonas aeruginosa group]MCT9630588.1 PhnD/SsuA/transferrin family substrate-binding protein [Pseudomonas aeruginosa]MCW8030428.1 PhnD/SsuA/transferrin family substrate-binding protein [Pseudomonas aeruginosa]MCW8031778.1 PhnD/SsuA/transferrin family substrate-binding protein [Pseudomonas aeruginosa]MDY1573299.1 PhnD/SsuA/transferrin family substrate-binding protein [Pseudomonas paraeruginosa]UYT232